jgi:hypothetical protein
MPGTTVTRCWATAFTPATSATEQTTPPHAAGDGHLEAGGKGAGVGFAGENSHAERHRRRVTPVGGAFGQGLDPGPDHLGAAGAVEREEGDAEAADHPGGPPDSGGDVVELQVEEHPPVRGREGLDGGGTGGAEQLQADLDDAEPGIEPGHEFDGGVEIIDVEGQSQSVSGGSRRHLGHGTKGGCGRPPGRG